MYLSAPNCNHTMRTTAQLINNGKVTVPAQIREEFDVEDGDLVEIDVRPIKEVRGGNNG